MVRPIGTALVPISDFGPFDALADRAHELYIDGASRPLRVFLGGSEDSPTHVPFASCN